MKLKLKTWVILFSFCAVLSLTALFTTIANAQSNTVTSTVTGTTTVDKTPPTASAPSVVINNQDVCTSAASAAVQTQILGVATGIAVTDENCERLKLARSLYGMGMKVAAVSMLCQDERVFDAMKMAGTPCPFEGKIGQAAQAEWDKQIEEVEKEEKSDENTVDDSVFFTILGLLIFLL